MSQNGEKSSQAVNAAWADIEKGIKEYYNSISLKIKPSPNIEAILNYTQEELRSLSKEECSENAYLLKQYALYIQKEMNRHHVKANWASARLNYIIGKDGGEYGDKYTKFEQLKLIVVAKNTYAKALYDMELTALTYYKSLYDSSNIIQNMARTLEGLHFAK